MTDDKERQVLRAFDDSPQRFRDSRNSLRFAGASGVLFDQAMGQTRMAICLSDPNRPDSPIVFANRAFIELTGYDEDDIVVNVAPEESIGQVNQAVLGARLVLLTKEGGRADERGAQRNAVPSHPIPSQPLSSCTTSPLG